jgi:DNA repair exonuclease SbcCD ATPase subunit
MYPKIDDNDKQEWASLDSRLSKITDYIAHEIAFKQDMISSLLAKVQELNDAVLNKDEQLEQYREKLAESSQNIDGLRQLLNKLLNDIENHQKDIDWYKRTYETRSLLGILKDKFFRGNNMGGQEQ